MRNVFSLLKKTVRHHNIHCASENMSQFRMTITLTHVSQFWKYLAVILLSKQAIIRCFSFPPHLCRSSAVRYLGKEEARILGHFHLNAARYCASKHTKQAYHLITAKPQFTIKMIECVHQTGPRKAAWHPAVCYRRAQRLPSLSRCRSLCRKC